MITSKDVKNKKFEKAAFGYKTEEVDEFLSQLEYRLDEIEQEYQEANNKIFVLAEKVKEYMKEEDALKDALIGAQKQGYQVINEANEKASKIIAEAKEKASQLEYEAVRQHAEAIEKNRIEITREKESLIEVRKQVSNFKNELLDMYKSHIELISSIPELFEDDSEIKKEKSINTAAIIVDK